MDYGKFIMFLDTNGGLNDEIKYFTVIPVWYIVDEYLWTDSTLYPFVFIYNNLYIQLFFD